MSGDRPVPSDPAAPDRRVAEALMRHGNYDETPDSVVWLRMEADEVAWLMRDGFGADEVVALLADTAWWDPTSETDERARAVAADLGVPDA
jgi:hypothetical protein